MKKLFQQAERRIFTAKYNNKIPMHQVQPR